MRDDFDVARIDEPRERSARARRTRQPAEAVPRRSRRTARAPWRAADPAGRDHAQREPVQAPAPPSPCARSLHRADCATRCSAEPATEPIALRGEQLQVGFQPLHGGFVVAEDELQPLIVQARNDFSCFTARPGSAIHSSVPLTSDESRASLRLATVPVAVTLGAKDCCFARTTTTGAPAALGGTRLMPRSAGREQRHDRRSASQAYWGSIASFTLVRFALGQPQQRGQQHQREHCVQRHAAADHGAEAAIQRAAGAWHDTIGNMPSSVVSVMETIGRVRVRRAAAMASRRERPCTLAGAGLVGEQDRVVHDEAHQHDEADHREQVERLEGEEPQHPQRQARRRSWRAGSSASRNRLSFADRNSAAITRNSTRNASVRFSRMFESAAFRLPALPA